MAKTNRANKNGLKTAYASTIVGIVLVLSVLGIVSWLTLGINDLKDRHLEELEVDIFFENSLNEIELKQYETEIALEPYTKKAFYRSAEEAWELTKPFVGDSALSVVDIENPLSQLIVLNLKKDYIVLDSMKKIEAGLMRKYEGKIKEVFYREEAFSDINAATKKTIYLVSLLGILLLIVAIALINNTIRLALYSKRFTIKTMQLVGATPRFIRKPFIWLAIWQGVVSGLISGALVFGFIIFVEQFIPDSIHITDINLFFMVLGGIILFGILITVISTRFALRKYLRLKLDNLYG